MVALVHPHPHPTSHPNCSTGRRAASPPRPATGARPCTDQQGRAELRLVVDSRLSGRGTTAAPWSSVAAAQEFLARPVGSLRPGAAVAQGVNLTIGAVISLVVAVVVVMACVAGLVSLVPASAVAPSSVSPSSVGGQVGSPVDGFSPEGAPAGGVVVAVAGDSLWSLAARYAPERDRREVVAELAELNGGDNLTVGQLVVLPASVSGDAELATAGRKG